MKVVKKSGTKAKKAVDKPWELSLAEEQKKPKKTGFSTGSSPFCCLFFSFLSRLLSTFLFELARYLNTLSMHNRVKKQEAGESSSSSSIFNAANTAGTKDKQLVNDASIILAENSNREIDTFDASGLDQVFNHQYHRL